jgi:ComF family protein
LAKRLQGLWSAGLSGLREFVYPEVCLHCGEAGAAHPLCRACLGTILRDGAEPACEACGAELVQEGTGCVQCADRGFPHVERVLRWSVYAGAARTLLLRAKFGGNWGVARWLGTQLAADAEIAAAVRSADVLCWTPLHWTRKFRRGFDQAELIARSLAEASGGKPCRRLLRRRTRTRAQSRQSSAAARRRNVAGAFVPAHGLSGQNVLLIDDILTTGATATESARALRNAGAGSVSLLVVAVTPRGSEERAG